MLCDLGADGSVDGVVIDRAGLLQGRPVVAQIHLLGVHQAGDRALLEVVLSGKDPPPGLRFKPNWVGDATLVEVAVEKRAGRATFSSIPSGVDPSIGPPPEGWPLELSGSIEWSCGG